MPNSSVERLPVDVKRWLVSTIMDRTYGSYDELLSTLNAKGYTLSRAALARFGKKLMEQSSTLKRVGQNLPEDEKFSYRLLRMRCLELARGTTPEQRVADAEMFLSWVLNT